MSSEKPNFLAQPVVKNIFMFRNGDPYYEARRIVINQKRVSNFETLLREVTGGIQAPFGAVRNIYTPREGHKVDSLASLQSGEQYVAAGRERFKKLNYQQIGSRKKRLLQTLPMQARPLPHNRITVSARFLKPIREPCTVFVVANGDVLNPAMRILIHQRMLSQFDRVLEMITDKMGMRVLGGVRSLYTYAGHQVTDGNQLESGQLYVAVGRDKFKKLMYSDLLFTKPRGNKRVNGMKAYSLPPIYRFSKQNGDTSPSKSKSKSQCSESRDEDSKASPPVDNGNNKEHLVSIVREISQARLLSFRKRRSGQSVTLSNSDIDDLEPKIDDANTDVSTDANADVSTDANTGDNTDANTDANADANTGDNADATNDASTDANTDATTDNQTPAEPPAEEQPADDDVKTTEENCEQIGEREEAAAENMGEEETVANNEEQETQEANGEKEGGEETGEADEQNNEREEEATVEPQEREDETKGEIKEEVTDEAEQEVKGEEQESSNSNSDETQNSEKAEDGSHSSSEGEKDEQETNVEEEKKDADDGNIENISNDQNNDVGTGEEEKETENSNDPGETQTDN